MNNTSVDSFLADGCGRCDHFRTPQCKVHQWTEPLGVLRQLLRASELTEEMKWGSPCYTLDGKNVVMLAAFTDHCAISFLQGALLTDEGGRLERPGANTHAARVVRFTTAGEVRAQRAALQGFVEEAVALARSGARVPPPPQSEPVPEELQARLDADPALRAAFEALTPGRQRSYVLHVSGAKQSRTRAARVERCIPKIHAGKGFHER